ncbi:MAG: hypothetical protein HY905_21850 [Deltaproteobacteria bacterium]|nr:hypothetical protein [Deltaproteobacteria bacterium]
MEQPFGLRVAEAPNHTTTITLSGNNVKRYVRGLRTWASSKSLDQPPTLRAGERRPRRRRTLFYWWRDEGKAVEQPSSPCYLNVINPADIALGEAGTTDLVRVLRDVTERIPWLGDLTECLAEAPGKPVLPPPGLRP